MTVDTVLNFLFPEACALCGSLVEEFRFDCLCRNCWQKLRDGLRPVANHDLEAAGWYGGLLEEAIRLMKYRGRRGLARGLGDLLAERWFSVARTEGCWQVIPIPLHPSRLRRRGYNQAELLARRLARAGGFPLCSRALRRTRKTQSQAGLSDRQRHDNVRGAFEVRRPRQVRNSDVILVDDVVTTGATVESCRKALVAAGAARVVVLALARAPRW
ncbi:MAG: ComF family protein [Acidobacteriota bacterium]